MGLVSSECSQYASQYRRCQQLDGCYEAVRKDNSSIITAARPILKTSMYLLITLIPMQNAKHNTVHRKLRHSDNNLSGSLQYKSITGSSRNCYNFMREVILLKIIQPACTVVTRADTVDIYARNHD